MFKQHNCNIKPVESYIRFVLATILMIYALVNFSIILIALSAILYYSSFKRFCFIYYLFSINEKYSLKNYYLSFLPKHNPSAVFIFGLNGKSLYENSAAKNELPNIKSIEDIDIKDYKDIIKNSH